MSVIRSIGVENFKLFKDKTDFRLAPITVLTGTNSSGKSSVVQALGILSKIGSKGAKSVHFYSYGGRNTRYAVESMFFDLDKSMLNDRLGDFSKLLSRSGKDDTLILSLDFPTEMFRKLRLSMHYHLSGEVLKQGKIQKAVISTTAGDSILEFNRLEFAVGEYDEDYFLLANVDFSVLWKGFVDHARETKEKWQMLQEINDRIKTQFNGRYKFSEEEKAEIKLWTQPLKDKDQSINKFSIYINIEEGYEEADENIQKLHSQFGGLIPKTRAGEVISWEWVQSIDVKSQYCYDYLAGVADKEGGYDALQDVISVGNETISNPSDINQLFEVELFKWFGHFNMTSGINTLLGDTLLDTTLESFVKNPLYSFLRYDCRIIPVMNGTNRQPTLGDREIQIRQLLESYFRKSESELGFNNLFVPNELNLTSLGKKYFEALTESLLAQPFELLKSFKDFQFLSSFRTKSTRIQKMMDGSDLGNVVEQVLARGVLQNKSALDFLRKYLRVFKIADDVFIRKDEESYQFKLYVRQGEEEFLLADIGYGYSQLLPILLKIAQFAGREEESVLEVGTGKWRLKYAPVTLVIEEPEANLHPALQSKLADLFYEAHQQFNIQFIVETHSEYLIRRLQVMTADPACEMTPEDTQIHYFYHPDDIPEGEPQVYPINIQEDGALSKNFGKGFFDESSNLNVALYNFTRNNYN